MPADKVDPTFFWKDIRNEEAALSQWYPRQLPAVKRMRGIVFEHPYQQRMMDLAKQEKDNAGN